jgi:hypothetical protein
MASRHSARSSFRRTNPSPRCQAASTTPFASQRSPFALHTGTAARCWGMDGSSSRMPSRHSLRLRQCCRVTCWTGCRRRKWLRGNGTALIQHTHGPQMVGADRIPKSLYFEVLRLIPLSDKVTRHHQRRVIGILRDIVMARRDHRNNGLNIGAYCFREFIPPVSRDAAERLLFIAAQMNGYVAKDGEGAAMATIQSGLGPRLLVGHVCV